MLCRTHASDDFLSSSVHVLSFSLVAFQLDLLERFHSFYTLAPSITFNPLPNLSFSLSHALVPSPPPPCMLKYSVKEGSRGGTVGECVARRGGRGGGSGGKADVKSAAVVMIFCSLFLGTSWPFLATVSSTVLTGSWGGGWRRKEVTIQRSTLSYI